MTEEGVAPEAAVTAWPALAPLEDRLRELITSTEKKRVRARRTSSRLFILQAALLSLTTIFIGLSQGDVDLNGLSLVTSSMAAFLALVQGYFGYSDRWRHFTAQVASFYSIQAEAARLRAFAVQFSNGEVSQEAIQQLYDRLDATLREGMEKWSKITPPQAIQEAIKPNQGPTS